MYLLAGKICATIAVVAIPVILPINLSGDYVGNNNLLNKMSMSNIRPGSPLLCVFFFLKFFGRLREIVGAIVNNEPRTFNDWKVVCTTYTIYLVKPTGACRGLM